MNGAIHVGDSLTILRTLPAESVQCCVTSPPYWGLRDYGVEGQIGLEETFDEFLGKLVAVFAEVRRVLRADGVAWVNMGDGYAANGVSGLSVKGEYSTLVGTANSAHVAIRRTVPDGLKPKDLVGQPWRLAFALQSDGWWLRSDCIWHKPNPMPESVTDRPTKAHEYVFLLTKSARYFYDAASVRQPYAEATLPQKDTTYNGSGGKDYLGAGVQDPSDTKRRVIESMDRNGGANLRTVWTIPTQPYAGAHFATFPEALAERCIIAGTSDEGCCTACGAPRIRRVGRSYENPGNRRSNGPRSMARRHLAFGSAGYAKRLEKRIWTEGWEPSCTCGSETGSCTVLDPFAGSGTVGAVATKLGRQFVGIELNPTYATLARQRIDKVAPLFRRAQVLPGAQEASR